MIHTHIGSANPNGPEVKNAVQFSPVDSVGESHVDVDLSTSANDNRTEEGKPVKRGFSSLSIKSHPSALLLGIRRFMTGAENDPDSATDFENKVAGIIGRDTDERSSMLIKDILVERLVFENTMCNSLVRGFLFFVGFLILNQVLMLSYPAAKLLPMHQAIETKFDLKDGLSSVETLSDMSSFLQQMAVNSRYFIPGSSDYASDPLARAYLPTVTATPPQVSVPRGAFGSTTARPIIGEAFTTMVWIKTMINYGSLLKKTVGENVLNTRICYDIGLERTEWGGHENQGTLHRVVHYITLQDYCY